MSSSIVEYMGQTSVQENINQTLRDRAPQFVTSVAALVNSNPAIASCEKKSVLSACLIAASLDLPINQNLGFAYIIPYRVRIKDGKDEKGIDIFHYEDQAQFQMGWKGFVQLAIRTEKYKFINVRDVREGEMLEENFLSGEITFEWKEARETLPVVGYVAYFKLVSGFEKMLYMTVADLQKHGIKYSKSMKSGYGQWKDDPQAMYRKTVIKLLISKYGIMTSSLSKAIDSDQAIVSDDKVRYVDNEMLDPKEVGNEKERARIIKHIQESKTVEELEQCELAIEDFPVNSVGDSLAELFKEKKKKLQTGEAL